MPEPTHVVSLRMSDQMHDELRQHAADCGTTMGKLVRGALHNFLIDEGVRRGNKQRPPTAKYNRQVR